MSFMTGGAKVGSLRRIVRHGRIARHARKARGGKPAGGVPASRDVRDNPGARRAGRAIRAPRAARDGYRSNARQFAKYLQGYARTRGHPSSTGPNDASTRQKHAFPS